MHFANQQLSVLRRKRAMSCRATAAAMVPNEHWRSTPRCIHRGLNRRSSFIVHRSSFSPAFTLVELLVVIAIIVTVSAIVVPLLTPVLDSRRIRESARIVSTQFASAQSEAMAKGRPVGVWIERLGADDHHLQPRSLGRHGSVPVRSAASVRRRYGQFARASGNAKRHRRFQIQHHQRFFLEPNRFPLPRRSDSL